MFLKENIKNAYTNILLLKKINLNLLMPDLLSKDRVKNL